jgi:hypothetical protein
VGRCSPAAPAAYLGASGQIQVHTLQGKGNPTDITVELE